MAAHRINPADLLKIYNVAELEKFALEQIQEWGDSFSIPVDIENILENTPNVDLDIYPRLRDRYGLEGMVGINDKGILTVYINDFLADNETYRHRYRMTVAEEFAHILLHREALENVRTPEGFLCLHKSSIWHICERNAKKLAAILLMPSADVLNDSRSLYSNIISKLPPEYRFTNSTAVKNKLQAMLAVRYVVSVPAMRFRLTEWPIQVDKKIDEAMKNHFDFLE